MAKTFQNDSLAPQIAVLKVDISVSWDTPKASFASGLISSTQLIRVQQQQPLQRFHPTAVMEECRRGKSGPLACHLADRKEAFRIMG